MKISSLIQFALLLLFVGPPAQALEGGHNLAAEFEARAATLEQVNAKHPGLGEAGAAYADYAKFLDKELDQAYSALLKKLSDDSKQNLIYSEKQWLQFRKSETQFIEQEWTAKNFGTSSASSRGVYASSLTKARVLTLLHYLQNYD